MKAYIIFFLVISPAIFGNSVPDSTSATVQAAQSSYIDGAVQGMNCIRGDGTTPPDLGTQAVGSHLANSSDVNFRSQAAQDMATLQKQYDSLNHKQSGGVETQKKLLLRMKSLLQQEIEEKEGSMAILNLAETKDVADAVVKLESMQTCRAAITKEYNEMISLYNDQIRLYSTAGAYLAEEQIKKEDGYVKTNKAFEIVENPETSWVSVDEVVKAASPVIEKLGKTSITNTNSTNEIPQIVKVKWACASGLRLSMGLLDRPFTEGGTNSIDQALTRYKKHSQMVNSLLVGCETMITHNLTGAPKDVAKFCADFIKNEEEVIAACPPSDQSVENLKLLGKDVTQDINQSHAHTSAAIANAQYGEDNKNQTMPEERAAQIAAKMALLQQSINVSQGTIKKIDQDLLKIEQLQNETKGKISFINLLFKKLKMGLHSLISVSYAKEKRTMQLTTNQKPLGCIFQGPQKGKCSSFQTLWENPGPGQKILGNRLDKSIQASIHLGDLMQTKPYLDEKGFQYIDELIKENANVTQTKNQLVARLDNLYQKEGFINVTHAKKTQSVLSRWQKVTQEVLTKLGKSVHFDINYADPLETAAMVRKSQTNNPLPSTNDEKVPRKSLMETYEDMKDASADDINTIKDISIFETISKKYLQKLNEF
ncbi:MAG: hypothetical protein A2202_02605 [Bdellovibrionales bacterium RIFOXYA1_FULL_36_14]|nr:MAG: hypothetical protein A2202_02605 [Bdellovibrionales bacterium RIFOXYA1_FULL_36_14]